MIQRSPLPVEQYLARVGQDPSNYEVIDLSASGDKTPDVIEALQESALERGCEYITDISPPLHFREGNLESEQIQITAKGLIPKKS